MDSAHEEATTRLTSFSPTVLKGRRLSHYKPDRHLRNALSPIVLPCKRSQRVNHGGNSSWANQWFWYWTLLSFTKTLKCTWHHVGMLNYSPCTVGIRTFLRRCSRPIPGSPRVNVEVSLSTEPLFAPDEQAGTMHGFLCHQWMNVCVNCEWLNVIPNHCKAP